MFMKNGFRRVALALLAIAGLPLLAPATHAQDAPLACDVDVDGDVDKVDIRLISDARGQTATGPTDPRDPDRDLLITSADARSCTARCTLPLCASPSNRPPVADAGADQEVFTGVVVTLDGSDSTDPDGDPLVYKWTVKRKPTGSLVTLTGASTVSPTFKPDLDGEYEFQLIVNDKQVDSAPDTVVVTTGNAAPVANAGPDQDVIVNSLVKLDGSGSSDINGDALKFSWSFVSRPSGSQATLSSSTAVMPTFTPDVAGTYELRLVVNDGKVDSAPDTVRIQTGTQPNVAPIADAGDDQSVDLADTVQLDGSGSRDPDNGPAPLTYSWSLIARPTGSLAAISSATAVSPTFRADKAGEYVAQLIVNDGAVASAPDTVRISTRNTKPIADAGDDQTGQVGQTINLDGRGSSDPDGDALSFQWSFTSRPSGSTASITDGLLPQARFVPDKFGLYVVQLVVNDGKVASDPDTANVTIEAPELPSISIDDASIAEGNSGTKVLTFTARLSKAASSAVTVAYATADGTATAGSDYTAKSSSLTFFAGQTSKTLTVTIRGDTTVEPDETFFVNLSSPTNATIADAQAIGTILNDDTAVVPALSIADVSITEGNSGTKTLNFTVTASPAPTAQITVNYVTQGGTATSGTDFQSASGTLTFPAGTATRTVSVTIIGDTTPEADETLFVYLSSPSGATIADGDGIGTIIDDDGQPAFTVSDASGNEGNSGTTTLVFTVSLTPASGTTARVNYATADGTATLADNDYESAAGTLEFTPGQTSKTVSVTVNGDTQDEPNETFTLQLSSPQGATIADGSATGTILNDDSSIAVQLLPNPLNMATRATATMTVNLSAPAPAGGYVVQLSSSDTTVATVPTSVTVLAGQQNADFTVTSLTKAGSVTITAQRNSATVASAAVVVTLRGITLAVSTGYVAVGGTLPGSITLPAPAPTGGATIQLSGSPTGIASFTPTSVSFAAGETVKGFTINGLAVGSTVVTASASGYESATRNVTVTNNVVSFAAATLTVGKDLQVSTSVRIPGTAPAGGIQVRVTSNSANIRLSTSAVTAGTQSIDLLIGQGTSTSGTFYVQSLDATGAAQLSVQILNNPDPPYVPGTPLAVTMVPSAFELVCQTAGCSLANNVYSLATTTQSTPTRYYIEALAINPAVTTNNRLGNQNVRGGYTITLPLTLTNASLGTFRAYSSGQPGGTITSLPIVGGEYYTYFFFDPETAGNGTIGFTKPAGAGTSLVNSQPYLQTSPVTVTGTTVEFTTAAQSIGKDLQLANYVRIPGAAPAGGLSLRLSSSSANVLLTSNATAAGNQTLDVTIAAGSTQSPAFYVQSLASTGTAQVTVEVLTSPNPGYSGGTPLAVTMVPSAFELACQTAGCSLANNVYSLATTTQSTPTRFYIQAVALNPTVTTNNRLGTQDVRGGYTITLPLTLTNASLGTFRAYSSGQPGATITSLPIAGGEYYTYFFFDPETAGNGTIGFTKPAGAGTPLVNSQPYLQSTPVTVTGTTVEFTTAAQSIGKDLQLANYVRIPGPAPAGGLSLRLSSSSANVLLSAVETTAGSQTLNVTIAAGSTQSPVFYVQSLAATGTAQVTVEVLTSPNPGYGPGTPLAVTMVPSGFEFYCQSSACTVVSNQEVLNAPADAPNVLMYIQALALNPAAVANNRLGTQNVRGGATITLPLTSTNAAMGSFRGYSGGTATGVITQLPIVAGQYYTYFYFDPAAAGNGTLGYTKPSDSGTPTVSGLPYLQSVLTTITPAP
jgi:hypothetical protein